MERYMAIKRSCSVLATTEFVRLLTKKFPMTKAVRKNRQDTGLVARMLLYSGSIHSPHKIRNIIMQAWPKSMKFHRGISPPNFSFV